MGELDEFDVTPFTLSEKSSDESTSTSPVKRPASTVPVASTELKFNTVEIVRPASCDGKEDITCPSKVGLVADNEEIIISLPSSLIRVSASLFVFASAVTPDKLLILLIASTRLETFVADTLAEIARGS